MGNKHSKPRQYSGSVSWHDKHNGYQSDSMTELPRHQREISMGPMKTFSYTIRWNPTLTVTLRLNHQGDAEAFCVHTNDETDPNSYKHVQNHQVNHTFFDLEKSRKYRNGSPRRLYCYGRQSRIKYVVARETYRLLLAGTLVPDKLNTKLTEALDSITTRCIICRSSLGADVHRPTLCSSYTCLREYLTADLDIRLEDLRFPSSAIHVLAASVQAVALKNDANLLPGWPGARLGSPGDVRLILQSLPSLEASTWSDNMQSVLLSQYQTFQMAKQAELLLSWICTRFRGMMLSAQYRYNLSKLTGVGQYFVIDSQPEVEANFAKHNHLQPRHILYHGTSIDRLYAVMVQGLQVLSGTTLAQHGAVYGKGIYMAREPSMALKYARGKIPKTTTPFVHLHGDVDSARVLFACEHAGPDTTSPSDAPRGMHVVQEPSRIIVRYIFLVPQGARFPAASEINEQILGNVRYLRETL